MRDRVYDTGAILFLALAVALAATAIPREGTGAVILIVACAVVFGIITITQRLPVTSLNLTVKVTPENEPRIAPIAREFLAATKADVMILFAWIAFFAVFRFPLAVFLGVEAILVITLLAMVFSFIGRLTKVA